MSGCLSPSLRPGVDPRRRPRRREAGTTIRQWLARSSGCGRRQNRSSPRLRRTRPPRPRAEGSPRCPGPGDRRVRGPDVGGGQQRRGRCRVAPSSGRRLPRPHAATPDPTLGRARPAAPRGSAPRRDDSARLRGALRHPARGRQPPARHLRREPPPRGRGRRSGTCRSPSGRCADATDAAGPGPPGWPCSVQRLLVSRSGRSVQLGDPAGAGAEASASRATVTSAANACGSRTATSANAFLSISTPARRRPLMNRL